MNWTQFFYITSSIWLAPHLDEGAGITLGAACLIAALVSWKTAA